MTTSSSHSVAVGTVALACHPATPCTAVHRIEVQVRRAEETLELRYCCAGDIERVLVSRESACRRADNLSQHTCFELFIAPDESVNEYYELNFAPSTEWAIYRFSAYREGMTAFEAALPPRISVRRGADVLRVDVVIHLDALPALRRSPGLRVALSAVIEETEHHMSYWALAHPPGKPDFHHAEGFALVLPGYKEP